MSHGALQVQGAGDGMTLGCFLLVQLGLFSLGYRRQGEFRFHVTRWSRSTLVFAGGPSQKLILSVGSQFIRCCVS